MQQVSVLMDESVSHSFNWFVKKKNTDSLRKEDKLVIELFTQPIPSKTLQSKDTCCLCESLNYLTSSYSEIHKIHSGIK